MKARLEGGADVRVLLLDAGNTVVYLDHAAVAEVAGLDAEQVARAERAAKVTYERLMRSGQIPHERGWFVFMHELLAGAGADGDLDRLVGAVRAEHDRLNLWRRISPGLTGALVRARQGGLRLGVVSNSEGGLARILAHVGVASHFEIMIDSAEVGFSKPDPRIFELAVRHYGVVPHEALYAGDIPDVDVEGARAAGLRAALIDTLDHYPDYAAAPRFRHTEELVDALLAARS